MVINITWYPKDGKTVTVNPQTQVPLSSLVSGIPPGDWIGIHCNFESVAEFSPGGWVWLADWIQAGGREGRRGAGCHLHPALVRGAGAVQPLLTQGTEPQHQLHWNLWNTVNNIVNAMKCLITNKFSYLHVIGCPSVGRIDVAAGAAVHVRVATVRAGPAIRRPGLHPHHRDADR